MVLNILELLPSVPFKALYFKMENLSMLVASLDFFYNCLFVYRHFVALSCVHINNALHTCKMTDCDDLFCTQVTNPSEVGLWGRAI